MVEARSTVSRCVAAIPVARKRAAVTFAAICAVLVAACAQAPRIPAGYPFTVEQGPAIRLLDVRTSHEQVAAVIDDAGFAHVLIASPKAKALRHVVVDPGGQVALTEVIRPEVDAASLDAEIDAAGQLHVLAGPRHFVREPSGQWSEAATPWATIDRSPAAPRFVHGAARDRPLFYAFDVGGKAVGAPARWDVLGFGGYGAGIIWPWRTHGSRLAVVAEDGGHYAEWSVVGLDDNEDVADWAAVATPEGRVHVVYDAQRSVLATLSMPRYACIDPATGVDEAVREIAGLRVRSVPGAEMPVAPERPFVGPDAALGYDAATSELLLVRQHAGGSVYRDGTWGPEFRMPLNLAWSPRIAAPAAGHFDIVAMGTRTDSSLVNQQPVFYLQFRDGRWSAPVEVGGAGVATLLGTAWDAVQVASDGNGHVLVTWPVEDGVEARWLHVPQN